PDHLGSFIVTLSTRNHSAANTFANKAALALAVELSYEFVEAAHKAVETAVHVSDNPFLGEFRDTLRDRKRDLQAEYERIKRVHNLDLDSLMSQYRDLLNVTEPKKYIETEKDIKG